MLQQLSYTENILFNYFRFNIEYYIIFLLELESLLGCSLENKNLSTLTSQEKLLIYESFKEYIVGLNLPESVFVIEKNYNFYSIFVWLFISE